MRMRGSLLALLIGVWGCSETQPFHGDVSFTAEERESVERGNAFLAQHVGQEPFAIVWDGDGTESLAISKGVRVGLAGHNDGTGRIQIGEGMASVRLSAVVAHELGHERGLSHHNGAGLMGIDGTDSLVWTADDQASCELDGICRD
jgi:hypothetical protein